VRFVWPEQRYDRLTRAATLVGSLVTTCAGLAIVLPAVRIYRAAEYTSSPATGERVETVTFLQPSVAHRPTEGRPSVARSGTTHISAASSLSRIDTSSLITNRVQAAARVAPTTKLPPNDSKTVTRALGPYSASAGVTLGRIDSGAAPPPPWRSIPETQAQRDSTGRAEAQRAATARDDHRPMPITLGSIPMRMPFGGAARSREQRARDSVVNDDYLRRLARLIDRARTKRDSAVAARMIARRDSVPAGTPKP
jgi:hypothetical protein